MNYLTIAIAEGKDLVSSMPDVESRVYCIVQISGSQAKAEVTKKVKNFKNPKWGSDQFTLEFTLNKEGIKPNVLITVKECYKKKDVPIGSLKVNLNEVPEDADSFDKWYDITPYGTDPVGSLHIYMSISDEDDYYYDEEEEEEDNEVLRQHPGMYPDGTRRPQTVLGGRYFDSKRLKVTCGKLNDNLNQQLRTLNQDDERVTKLAEYKSIISKNEMLFDLTSGSLRSQKVMGDVVSRMLRNAIDATQTAINQANTEEVPPNQTPQVKSPPRPSTSYAVRPTLSPTSQRGYGTFSPKKNSPHRNSTNANKTKPSPTLPKP